MGYQNNIFVVFVVIILNEKCNAMPKFILLFLFVGWRKFWGHVNLKKEWTYDFFSFKLKIVVNIKPRIWKVFFHQINFIEMLSFFGSFVYVYFLCCMCLLIEKLKDINAGEWASWGDIGEVSGKIALLPLNATKDFQKCIQLFFATLTLFVWTIFTTWKTLVDTLVEGCCLHKILVILESAVIFWYRWN